MKTFLIICPLLFFLRIEITDASSLNKSEFDNNNIEILINQLAKDIQRIHSEYDIEFRRMYHLLSENKRNLIEKRDIESRISLLVKKDAITEQIAWLRLRELTDISKIRYIKGLQIIKILYEKTLALDHHFASVSTFSEINKISNPNNYPAFNAIKDQITTATDKKRGFDLTEVLGTNIYTSVAHSLISLFTSSNVSKNKKEASLKEVECILDFTLRMHNDLNTIYFETVFLQRNNEDIMEQLDVLFVEFTKPIQYRRSLSECRSTDDWDSVRDHLSIYINTLENIIADPTRRRKAQKMQINLEFPIDRLLQFISQYNAFIDQGGKFYEKFGIMLDSYENAEQCADKIPVEYQNLKANIAIAIEKFNTAYKPVEINGSKMKEILYGINEYE